MFDGKGDVLRAPSELTGASVTNSVVPEGAPARKDVFGSAVWVNRGSRGNSRTGSAPTGHEAPRFGGDSDWQMAFTFRRAVLTVGQGNV